MWSFSICHTNVSHNICRHIPEVIRSAEQVQAVLVTVILQALHNRVKVDGVAQSRRIDVLDRAGVAEIGDHNLHAVRILGRARFLVVL